MISDHELQRIRVDLQAQVLPDLCHILTKTSVSDGQGGFTDTWGTAYTNIECLLEPYGGRGRSDIGLERDAAGRIQAFSTWALSVPVGTNLTTSNRVECNGQTFNVTAMNPEMSWSACVMFTLERV